MSQSEEVKKSLQAQLRDKILNDDEPELEAKDEQLME